MTEQEFRASCAKFDIKIVPSLNLFNDTENFLICQLHDIILGYYYKNSCLAVITNNFVKNTYYIFGKMHNNLVNSDLEHTTNFLHNDKMEERFAYLIKTYKQEIINERLEKLENDFR